MNKMSFRSFFLAFILILLYPFAYGQMTESPVYHTEASQHFTSDEIYMRHQVLEYKNHKRDLFWPFANEKERAWDWGFQLENFDGASQADNFSAYRFQGLLGRKVSSQLYWQVTAGVNAVKNETTHKELQIGIASAQIQWVPNEKWNLQQNIERDLQYKNLNLPAAINSYLSGVSLVTWVNYFPHPLWRLQLQRIGIHYNDENLRQVLRLKAMYGISPSWPWIWLGLGGERQSTEKNLPGYWTPDNFSSLGIYLDAAFPIYKKLQGFSEVQLNKIKEDDFEEGKGRTYLLGLQYGNRNEVHFKLYASKIESSQGGNTWEQTTYYFTFNY